MTHSPPLFQTDWKIGRLEMSYANSSPTMGENRLEKETKSIYFEILPLMSLI